MPQESFTFIYKKKMFLRILARVGFEPTRTFVHWNLSPTP